MKKQGLKFKVINTEKAANGAVKLMLRSNQPVTPAMRRAMSTGLTRVVRGNKSNKVVVMLDTQACAERNDAREHLVENLAARATRAA